MKFISTPLLDAFLIQAKAKEDHRGQFSRIFCVDEFKKYNLETQYVQSNISLTKNKGTIRGLHFQRNPYEEVKLVRCIKGSIYDVIIDVRKNSETYLESFGAELTEENGLSMYVRKGFAHGFQALSSDATTHYMVSTKYEPNFEGGYRYNDPGLDIKWPHEVTDVSEKDIKWPLISQ